MKCLILAGGRGERLWPLSRMDYPKQFIPIQNNHSIFQETVARNLPYCDEFIIVTGFENRYIVENQMTVFQGTAYRCIYEENPLGTAAAITAACRDLPMSELVFVMASNHLLDSEEGLGNYKDAVTRARNLAQQGRIVTFGLEKKNASPYMGFIRHCGEEVTEFVAKSRERFANICADENYLRNSGMYLFEKGTYENELSRVAPDFYDFCQSLYRSEYNQAGSVIYKNTVDTRFRDSIEKILMARSSLLSVVDVKFGWKDITCLNDLTVAAYHPKGTGIAEKSPGTMIVNDNRSQIVYVDGLEDLTVVNTQDVVYVGKKGKAGEISDIYSRYPELRKYVEKGTTTFRSWGFYEDITAETGYRVRKVTLFPGKSIFPHRHKMREENWIIVEGNVVVILDDQQYEYGEHSNICVPRGTEHQISNVGDGNAVFIEIALGDTIFEEDNIATQKSITDVKRESVVKLRPAFKDYLWGGTKIRERYRKKSELNMIAESWELSAHPAGQSIVDSGRFKGLPFGAYLTNIGKKGMGWKVQPGEPFPLLVKFIDAKEMLSIQVHPGNDYALEHEGEYGKCEMWYILDCEKDAFVYVGFKRATDRQEVETRIRDHTLPEILNKVYTHPGDVFFIPAGTVHAVGAGNLLCEVQQSSNCTYRLYDYDRKDRYGNVRKLQLAKALDVLDYSRYQPYEFDTETTIAGTVVSRCKFFEVIVFEVQDEVEFNIDNSHFASVLCLSGEGELEVQKTKYKTFAGDSFFVQAGEKVRVSGKVKILVSWI